jgi:iron(III) transport system ATP-binding protein
VAAAAERTPVSDAVVCRLHAVTLTGRSRPRLDAVSLTIPAGITAVLGESGAGKTSLLNLLVGFETPTQGRVEVTDALSMFWSPPDHGLWPHLTVRQHLEAVAIEAVDGRLADFDMTAAANAYPATLSQGERVRVGTARALASGAAVLVLDEPFANLDGPHRDRSAEALRRHAGARAIVFSTHQPELALRLAEYVICLSHGRVLACGSPRELYAAPPNREVAELLGPVNWFDPEESVRWLSTAVDGGVRPERLRLEPSEVADLEVISSESHGPLEQVTLRHRSTATTRAVLHPTGSRRWQAGDRVVLRVLWALLVMSLLGCQTGDESLPVKSATAWSLPIEGAQLPGPRAVTAGPDGTIYALDNVGRLLAFNPLGEPTKQWWMPEYTVGRPERILVCRDGRLAIADTHYHRVVFFDADGKLLGMFGREGEGPGEFVYPVAIAEDDRRNLYVCEYGGHDRVQIFGPDGEYVGEFGSFGVGPGQFQRPSGIVWRDGRLYIADAFNNRIFVCNEQGEPVALPTGAFAADLHYPYDIATGPSGAFYVVEYGAGRVTKFAADGTLVGRYVGDGDAIGPLRTPWGLGVAPDGRVLVADTGNRRLVQIQVQE